MDSLPSLQNLHLALTSEDSGEPEEELLSIISHLLVCAIEDPGIPNPVRHTTLLGQSLRTADLTNSNISEILRIYLYATATGEIRTMYGATLDRERERRVADHHQLDSEQIINSSSGKNLTYYEHLHENITWKLSECLKDKPYVALNPTVKTQILAHLCNDLLLNKAVLKQIDGSLESMAQHKKEKFVIENRVRKYKHLHTRKVRLEQFEKQQLLIKQQQQEAAAKEAETKQQQQQQLQLQQAAQSNDTSNPDNNNDAEDEKDEAAESLVKNVPEMANESTTEITTDKELTNHKEESLQSIDVAISSKNGTEDSDSQTKVVEEMKQIKAIEVNDATRILNNGASTPDIHCLLNKKIINAADASVTDGIIDDDLSDLESEGTMLEEDEDNRMTADEVQKKLEKILKTSYQNKMLLEQSCNQLRATCFGQDRFWRRYWHLPKTGGIFVEGIESAEPEILKYHEKLEELYKEKEVKLAEISALQTDNTTTTTTNLNAEDTDDKSDNEAEADTNTDADTDANADTEPETQADADIEADVNEVEADAESIDEKRKSRERKHTEDGEEESIPTNEKAERGIESESDEHAVDGNDDTANQLQSDSEEPGSRSSTPLIDEDIIKNRAENGTANQIEKFDTVAHNKENNKEDDNGMMDIEDSIPTAILVQKANKNDETVVEVNNQIGGVTVNPSQPKPQNNAVNDQLHVVEPKLENEPSCDIKPKLENGSIESVKADVVTKTEASDDVIEIDPANDTADVKLEQPKTETIDEKPAVKGEIIESIEIKDDDEEAMERWFSIINREIQLTSTESAIPRTSQNAFANLTCDLVLQFQGNRWDIGNNAHHFHVPTDSGTINLNFSKESILSLSGLCEDKMSKVLNGEFNENDENDNVDDKNDDMKSEDPQPFQLPTFLANSCGNISTFIQCDIPPPLAVTAEELELIDHIKANGFSKRKERNFVSSELRYGWWKLNDVQRLNDILQSLNIGGVRERDLRMNLLNTLTDSIDLSTHCLIADPESSSPEKGYVDPEPFGAWDPQIARRVELALLDQVEALEDKIAGASMQVKGWAAPARDPEMENEWDLEYGISIIRERILDLEVGIERRYLKPPLGTSTADAHLAAITTQNLNQSQTQSHSKENLAQSSQNDDQNSSAGSVATTPEREIVPKGTKGRNPSFP